MVSPKIDDCKVLWDQTSIQRWKLGFYFYLSTENRKSFTTEANKVYNWQSITTWVLVINWKFLNKLWPDIQCMQKIQNWLNKEQTFGLNFQIKVIYSLNIDIGTEMSYKTLSMIYSEIQSIPFSLLFTVHCYYMVIFISLCAKSKATIQWYFTNVWWLIHSNSTA